LINIKVLEPSPYLVQSLISIGETHNTSHTVSMSNLRDAALPMNVTGDAISATASLPFGLDAPSDTSNPPSFFARAYQKLISSVNVFDVTRFSFSPSKIVTSTKETMADLRISHDEMDLKFFCNRWGRVSVATPSISTSTAVGTNVISAYLIPGNARAATQALPSVPVTSAALSNFQTAIASQFQYWRGSLKYRLILASNSYTRCKLLVTVNYGTNVVPGAIVTGQPHPRSQHHIVVDISNTDKYVDIDIPYRSASEILRHRFLQWCC